MIYSESLSHFEIGYLVKLRTSSSAALATAAVLLLHGLPLPLLAQDASAVPLTVTVLTAQGSVNSGKQNAAQVLTVRVDDVSGQPVAGALVLFTAPNYGASGSFLDDLKSLQVTADQHGVAVANGFHANSVAGPFEIKVKAVYGTQTGYAVIQQVNSGTSSGLSHRTWWIIAAVVVAGAAGGTAAALHSGSGSSTSISPGGVTVGAPH
jgi:hypothetical protein